MKNNKIYTADFETANAQYNIDNNITWIWLWDICDIDTYTHVHGKDMDSFISYLAEIAPCTLYFHNAKFDVSFILDYLLKHGYKYSNAKVLKKNRLKTLIADTGVFYSLKFKVNIGKISRIVEIRDSNKKIQGTVDRIAKDYKLPILKESIDYLEFKPQGYDANADEIRYIEHDTEIIARVLHLQYDNGLTKLTSASDTFYKYKELVGRERFEKIFPVVDIDTDDYIRKSYRGGVVQVNRKYKMQELHDVEVYDVNSMYPAQMCHALLPYGKPKFFKGRYKYNQCYPLYIQRINVDLELKPGYQPTILHKGFMFLSNTYLEDTEGEMIELTLTSVDIQLMFKHYYVHDIEYIDGYMFMGSYSLFKDFIAPIYKKKCESSGAVKQLQKIYLNSLYGKFATSPRHINKTPDIVDDVVHYSSDPLEIEKPIYTAVASFITAYSRLTLFRAIQDNHDNFVYCDTDSVHVLNGNFKGEIHDSNLGAFKLEKVYAKAIYLGQKAYIGYKKDESCTVGVYPGYKKDLKLAGCSENCKQYIEDFNFKIGTVVHGKLLPKTVVGGTVLVPTDFTIKDRELKNTKRML